MLVLAVFLLAISQTCWTLCNNTVVTKKAFFDVAIGDDYWGRILIELFGDVTPLTVFNFASFAENRNDKGYRGTTFNKVYPNMAIQGGDFVNWNGSGSVSVFNDGQEFPDENFYFSNRRGWIGMANRGKDTNGCQFFINIADNTALDGIYVVFGRVQSGMDVVDKIASLPLDADGVPYTQCTITGSGTFHPVAPYKVVV